MRSGVIRIAIVGLGKIARDQHLAAIAGNDRFALAATVGLEPSPVADVPHFGSFDALLAEGPAFDAVALCTPPQVRFVLCRQAVAAGKHVLLEKPPGTTPSDIAALRRQPGAGAVSLFCAWHSRFAGGVEPARAWLAQRTISKVEVVWREDVRVWHPGQAWIWQPGGLGVFDPGINALSILSQILPGSLRLTAAELQVPANLAMPIAADLTLEGDGGVAVRANFDFRQTGQQSWDINVATDAGTLHLANGGADLGLPSGHQHFEDREYAGLYAHFACLIDAGASDLDVTPLQLVADAFLLGSRTSVAPFDIG